VQQACSGKWHLGFGEENPDWNGMLKSGPLELGFDYYFGIPAVNSGPPFVYVENHRVVGLDPDDPFVMGQESATQKWPAKHGSGAIDGHDLSDLFRGELPETSERNTFVYYTNNTEPGAPPQPKRLSAVRQGKWKYYLTPQRFRLAGSEEFLQVPAGALFDLENDVAEALDVAGEHPGVVRKMKAFAEKTSAELGDGARMGAGVRKAAYMEHALPMNAGAKPDL